jgi:sulfur-carrier protein adenylyltransferase/sulfurtransferase
MNARYERQMVLPEVGSEGQARLARARVLVAGAGGLGCAVLAYLAAAGIGDIIVADPDLVEESNLHRQPLYRMSDVGTPKVAAAHAALAALNPGTCVHARQERLTPATIGAHLEALDVVVDAADSLALTYMLSDACQKRALPLVSASVLGLSGYAGVFCGGGPSYRAVFPDMPRTVGSCAHNGVLGTAVGVMGTLQAHLTLALLLKMQPSPLGRLVSLDFRSLHFGGFAFQGARESAEAALSFITPAELSTRDVVIELRSRAEAPEPVVAHALRIDVESLERAPPALPAGARVVLCCRSGVRAWRAARALQAHGHDQLVLLAAGE